jgi:hypothetical protein
LLSLSTMRQASALIATIFILIAYLPYIADVKRRKTRPHPYTWFISGFLTFIVFFLQLTDGGGLGTIPTFVGAVAGIVVFALSLGPKRPAITKSDTVFFILALIATGLWLIAKQPLVSVILLTLIDILAFAPTIRKSWHKPDQETVITYFANATRFAFSVIALQNYTAVTVLYPAASVIEDSLIGVYLLIRRKKLDL